MEEFKSNIKDLETPYEFFCSDSFKFDRSLLKNKFSVYFYDGDHSVISHEQALTYYYDYLENYFIYICDDWNSPDVQEGTKRGSNS
jgi:hypothetical protein